MPSRQEEREARQAERRAAAAERRAATAARRKALNGGDPEGPSELPRGWLTRIEVEELATLAAGKVVLELGAWRGRSTVVMARTATLVVSVDRHLGIQRIDESDSLPDYLDAVRTLPNVVPVIGTFGLICPLLRDIDMVYIDGDHELEAVRRDIDLALITGARMIVFHDWDFADVREAAHDKLGRKANRVVGTVASYRIR